MKGNYFLSLIPVLDNFLCIIMGHMQLFHLQWMSPVILKHKTTYMRTGYTYVT